MLLYTSSFINQSGVFLTWFDFIGFLAVIFAFLAFYVQDKQMMRLYGLISTAFFGVGIFFYEGVNGLFVTMVSISIKLLTLTYQEDDLNFIKKITPFLALIFFLFFNPEGLMGILPAISLIFIAIADTQKDPLQMKYWYFGSAFCWLAYAVSLGSIPAIAYDVVGIMTLSYGVYSIHTKNKMGFVNKGVKV